MLAARSARTGNFTLASGRQSSLYIDARITTMSPDGLVLIGQLGLSVLRQTEWGNTAGHPRQLLRHISKSLHDLLDIEQDLDRALDLGHPQ